MDFDFMSDDILNDFDSYTGKCDFHTELQKTAIRCTNNSDVIHDEWNNMLSSILNNWDADVKMSLFDAVDYMMSVCGYDYFGKELLFSDKSNFWFLQSEQYRTLGLDELKNKRLYCVTIAIFESINYWCWHDSPVQVTFSFEELKNVLKHGNIVIDWSSYAKFKGGDSSLI